MTETLSGARQRPSKQGAAGLELAGRHAPGPGPHAAVSSARTHPAVDRDDSARASATVATGEGPPPGPERAATKCGDRSGGARACRARGKEK